MKTIKVLFAMTILQQYWEGFSHSYGMHVNVGLVYSFIDSFIINWLWSNFPHYCYWKLWITNYLNQTSKHINENDWKNGLHGMNEYNGHKERSTYFKKYYILPILTYILSYKSAKFCLEIVKIWMLLDTFFYLDQQQISKHIFGHREEW